MWDPQVTALARQLPASSATTRAATAARHAARPVLDRRPRARRAGRCWTDLGVERAHFAGLSLGGMVGQWLAIDAPERIDRLVLLLHLAAHRPARALDRPREDSCASRAPRRSSTARRALVHRGPTPQARSARAAARDARRHRPDEGYASAAASAIERDGPDATGCRHGRGPDAGDRRRAGPATPPGRARARRSPAPSPARGSRSSTPPRTSLNVERAGRRHRASSASTWR